MNPMKMVIAAAMAIAACLATDVTAQAFPAKTVRIVVPQAPGGASDALARIIGQRLSERWHQPVIVENRAGAGGLIGTDVVAKAAPDGYTLLLAYDGTHAVNASLYKSLPFDPIKDFTPVATLANVPFVLAVNAASTTKDIKGFIELAKADPGKVTYGSAGNGSVNHLLGAMFSKAAGVQLVHVPYKGAAPAIADLMGFSVDSVFSSIPSVVAYVQSGRLRALAVTSASRSAALPGVPTIAESGFPGFDVAPWFGLLAPAGTPPEIVKQINDDVGALLKSKETIDAFAAQGAEPSPRRRLRSLRSCGATSKVGGRRQGFRRQGGLTRVRDASCGRENGRTGQPPSRNALNASFAAASGYGMTVVRSTILAPAREFEPVLPGQVGHGANRSLAPQDLVGKRAESRSCGCRRTRPSRPWRTSRKRCGDERADRREKQRRIERLGGGASSQSPAHVAPRSRAKCWPAVSPGRVKANTSRP